MERSNVIYYEKLMNELHFKKNLGGKLSKREEKILQGLTYWYYHEEEKGWNI